jgi:FixJ family two-component response regulator
MLDIPNKENVLVIVLTTSTNLSDIEKLKGSGNTDFINKPLTKEKIQSILEKYFPEVAQDLKF